MSTVRGPRPQNNSTTETRAQNQPAKRLLPSPPDKILLRTTYIPKSQFVGELRAPPPLRARSRYRNSERQPRREMVKQHAGRKSEPSPLANSCMTWEEMIQYKPRDGAFPYQSPRYSGYGQNPGSSSTSFCKLDIQQERRESPQIYDVDFDSDDESGVLCFGRCSFTSMFSLCNPFTTPPSRATPNNLLVGNRYSSRHLPLALL
ncbi:hypothetical protein M413DRAFT_171877 [Hebeloma cylindrosporum]|uniref:Uncharacterized protein n=1 Tax=Hebeloma cylindrosporum TaxID=76867 RepID=A0A0C3C9A6_HEBCY|nr:hypothetical protein M413DRAFT_171877 [Hebeloma cylindrosporum h7]